MRAARGTAAVAATSCPHTSQQRRVVATAPGVVQQWRGWPHRADSDGNARSRRPDVTVSPDKHVEDIRGSGRPPFEGVAC
jgi:ectoine hydroxylase-related dioxygenase (phytanoyl-CoA dioxygenase family)